jgi:hypothetical protein
MIVMTPSASALLDETILLRIQIHLDHEVNTPSLDHATPPHLFIGMVPSAAAIYVHEAKQR